MAFGTRSALPRLVNRTSQHNPSCPVAAALYESLHADVRLHSQSKLSRGCNNVADATRPPFCCALTRWLALHARQRSEALPPPRRCRYIACSLYLMKDKCCPTSVLPEGCRYFFLWFNIESIIPSVTMTGARRSICRGSHVDVTPAQWRRRIKTRKWLHTSIAGE